MLPGPSPYVEPPFRRVARIWRGWLLTVAVLAGVVAPVQAQGHVHPGPGLPHGVPDFCAEPTVTSVGSGAWSDGATWSTGRPPGADDKVVITAGTEVTYDVSSSGALNCMGVHGRLAFVRDVSTQLTVGTLMVMDGGELEVGTADAPISAGVRAEIVIANQALDVAMDPEQFGTGLIVFGKIRTHGAPKRPTFVRLSGEPKAGDSSLTLKETETLSGWQIDDELILPDTRQLVAGERFANLIPQWERLTVAGLLAGHIVPLMTPLAHDHHGAWNAARTVLEYPPHVGNLTRNVVIRSADPLGTRGHTIYTHTADVDIRYTQFKDLGRTTNALLHSTEFHPDGTVKQIGTNQIGRYPLHIHHLRGPANVSDTGYQFQLIGNSVVDSEKWPLTVHQSHYGLIMDNVVFNGTGSGYVTEDGNESFNEFIHNFGVGIIGQGRPTDQDGRDGSIFWFKGFNHFVRDNVGANAVNRGQNIVNGAGFNFTWPQADHGKLSALPLFRGADVTVPTERRLVNMFSVPIPDFSNNEAYGAMPTGLLLWQVGTDGYNVFPIGETLIRNFVGWHLHESAFFGYPTHNVVFDGWVVRGHPRALGIHDGPGTGWWSGDYKNRNVTIRKADIQGMQIGISVSTATEGTLLIENSRLQNHRANITVSTLETPGTQAVPDSRTTIVRDTNFVQMPPPPVPDRFRTISMQWADVPRDPNFYWPDTPDRVFVYNYTVDGAATGVDFQLFYDQQETRTIAGGMAPCSNRSRVEIDGITCNITSLAPIITGIDPTRGPTAGGTVVTIDGENFATGASVLLGGMPVGAILFSSSNTITVETPPHAEETVGVTVRNPDGQSFRVHDAFRFTDAPPPDPENHLPTANDSSHSTAEDQILDVRLSASDLDGDHLSFAIVTSPMHGSLTMSGQDGTYTYTPDADYHGADSFTFSANDGQGVSNVATVSLTITAVNDAPKAADDQANTDEDTAADINVLGNDTDGDGDSLSVSIVTQPTNGSTSINADGTIHYTPNGNFNGEDSFAYTVDDHNGSRTTASVTVQVAPVNDAPALTNPGDKVGIEGEEGSLVIQATDPDGEGPSYSAEGLPDGLSMNADTGVISGTLTTPGMYNVTITASDGELFDTETFTWRVDALILRNPGDQWNDERDRVRLQLETTLPRGGERMQRPSFSATGLPPGLTLNRNSGLIHGRLRRLSAGVYAVTVMVTAGETSASASFTWTVERREDLATDPEAEEPDDLATDPETEEPDESDGEAETSESLSMDGDATAG